ncbi:MAG: DUF3769 domain-containing protein, partial [Cyanobacteriota bacterium]|nr:DUF3769 domain-containing protein [Cyanobacteriota bacterium]
MLHPVLPPEIPNVVESQAVADANKDNSIALSPESSTVQKSVEREKTSSPPKSFLNQNQNLSKTSEPETILPNEFSPNKVGNNAAPPGEKFTVSYPSDDKKLQPESLKHFEAASFTQGKAKSATNNINKKLVNRT